MSGGYGAGWGLAPWGGLLLPSTGGNLPPALTGWDIYVYYEWPDSLGAILEDPNVQVSGGAFAINLSEDLCVRSGGAAPSTDAYMHIAAAVPASYTFQTSFVADGLPPDLSNLAASHVYVGAANQTGFAAGLFLSSAGIAYTGAVYLASGTLMLTGPMQTIPGTAGLLEQGVGYTVRIVVDATTSTSYVFVTETDPLERGLTGHHLLAILPTIPTRGLVADGTYLSLRGTVVRETHACFSMFGMATGLYMPNVPPRSDAGRDQSLRMCSVGILDGSASADPEGGALTYSWRLVDAPATSSYAFEGHDGYTVPLALPTGHTDRFYSSELGNESLVDAIQTGDVLLFGSTAYSVLATGVDDAGFYARTTTNAFPDNLVSVPFKLLRARFLSNAATVSPSFYPDVPGVYKFDLVVYDGQYLSTPSTTVVNVLESQVPKGCIPDLSFMWQHLSDFWKLVEDRERIQVLWEGLAQVAAAELLTLWQVDYSKSLRDIQRTFQRRWLHYDLRLPEPLPGLTSVRRVYGGVRTRVAIPGAGVSGVQGTTLTIESPVHAPLRIQFQQANPYTADKLQSTLQVKLQGADSRYSVVVLSVGSAHHLLVVAPFYFRVGADSTVPVFLPGATNAPPSGTSGTRLAARMYRVDRSLQGLQILDGDLLVIDGEGYKISRVVDDASDPLRYQRLVLQADLPLLPGETWSITSIVTSRLLNFHGGLVSAGDLAVFEVTSSAAEGLSLLSAEVTASCPAEVTRLGVDLTAIDEQLSAPTVTARLAYVVRRSRLPIGDLVTDIPCLQEFIQETDSGAVIRRNVDYFLEQYRGHNSIRFVAGNPGDPGDIWQGGTPPDRLWAEVTYFDNSPTIEANFGVPAEFTLDQLAEVESDLDYLSAVRGLWYSYLNGPTMFNLRVGAQILLGLPFAEEAGVIVEIRTDFSATQGRILLRDTASAAIVRSYHFPLPLGLETNPATGAPYAVGDTVKQFAPLVQGVDVVDYVKDPAWFEGIMHQGVFFEVEKFHKFMMRVDSAAFSLSSLMFVRDFVLRVKPTYTFPLFVVRASVKETEVSVLDTVVCTGRLILNDGARFDAWNYSTMLDDYRAAGGGVRNQLDTNSNPFDAPPVFPTPDQEILWGLDKNYLSPEDHIVVSWMYQHAGGVVPLDSGFRLDNFNTPSFPFVAEPLTAVPEGQFGYLFTGTHVAGVAGSIELARLTVQGGLGPSARGDYILLVSVNSTMYAFPLTVPPGGMVGSLPITGVVVAPGDSVTLRLRTGDLGARVPAWTYFEVTLDCTPVTFQLDTGLAAGTYSTSRVL